MMKSLLLTILFFTGNILAYSQCIANAGGNVTICGTSYTLQGSAGTGSTGNPSWALITKPPGSPDPVITGVNTYTPNVTGMTYPGNYVFQITQPCASTSSTSQVTVSAPGDVSTFTAGPDITGIPATTGVANLNATIPAGYNASWTYYNLNSFEFNGTIETTNATMTGTTTATPTLTLTNKANHTIDPAYRVILRITSAINSNCWYEDSAVVRFTPNPNVSFPSSRNFCASQSTPSTTRYFYDPNFVSPKFSDNTTNASANSSFGTLISMNVISQPAGGNLAYGRMENGRLYFASSFNQTPGAYVFTLTISNADGTYTTQPLTFNFNGSQPQSISFIDAAYPDQMALYSPGDSAGALYCNKAGTTTPITFSFKLNPADSPTLTSTVTASGTIPAGGAPNIVVGGAGTMNRTVTLTPLSGGWQVGTYRFSVIIGNGTCVRAHIYYVHISDGNRPNVVVNDQTVCYPGSGVVSAMIPLPAVYKGVVSPSYFQDFTGTYQLTVVSRPSGSAVPTFDAASLRTLTNTSTVIGNLNMQGEYVFRIKASAAGGSQGFLDKEYACSGTSLEDTFSIFVSTQVNSNAGSDTSTHSTSTVLNGNNPGATSTGVWTLVSKPAAAPDPIIVTPTAYNSNVTGFTVNGDYTFRWTITTGGCTSSDDVTINYAMIACEQSFDGTGGVAHTINSDGNLADTFQTSLLGTGSLGGERDIAITNKSGAMPYNLLVYADSSNLEISHGGGDRSLVTVQYDGIDGNAQTLNHTGLGGLNFSPVSGIGFTVVKDSAPIIVTVELWSNSGAASSYTKAYPSGGATTTDEVFSFSNFTPLVGSGVDLTNIGAVVFKFDATTANNADFNVYNLRLVCPSVTDLSVTKTDGTSNYIPGTDLVYTVTVTNNGPTAVTGATVTDPVPAGIPAANVVYTAVASSGSTTNVVGSQNGAINDIVSLPVNGTVTYTVKVSVPSSFTGNLVNTATVTSPANVIDNNTSNNAVTDTNTSIANCPLAISNAIAGYFGDNSSAPYSSDVTPYGSNIFTGNYTASIIGGSITAGTATTGGTYNGTNVNATTTYFLVTGATNAFNSTRFASFNFTLNANSPKMFVNRMDLRAMQAANSANQGRFNFNGRLAIVDVATGIETILNNSQLVTNNYTSIIPTSSYIMTPGKTYQVKLYVNNNGNTYTNLYIDNPVFYAAPIPQVNTSTQICLPSLTGTVANALAPYVTSPTTYPGVELRWFKNGTNVTNSPISAGTFIPVYYNTASACYYTAGNSVVVDPCIPVTPFVCNDTTYLLRGPNTAGELFKHNLITGITDSTPLATFGGTSNALAYSPIDNTLWLLVTQDPLTATSRAKLTRVDGAGVITTFDIPNLSTALGINPTSAAITSTGYYVAKVSAAISGSAGAGMNDGDNYVVVDINPARPTYLQIVDPANGYALAAAPYYKETIGNVGMTWSDFAYRSSDGLMYGLDNNSKIATLNIVTGAYTVGNSVTMPDGSTLPGATFPASYIDNTGSLYQIDVSGNTYRIMLPSGNAVFMSQAASNPISNGDGANCPTAILAYTVQGNVFNDANGLTDNIVNGTGTNASNTLNAILYNNTTGTVAAVKPVAANGAFAFSTIPGNSYTVYVTTNTATVGQTTVPVLALPSGYSYTGENNCVNTAGCTGSDGTPDGVLSLGPVNADITQANFGVRNCLAGTIQPLVNTFVVAACPAGTANLNTQAHTGTVPAGATLVWFTDSTHTTAVTNPSAVGAGTYYAFYYDVAGNCYSPASQAVSVVVFVCSPCTPSDNQTVNLSTNFPVAAPPIGATTEWHSSATPSAATLLSSTTIQSTPTPTSYWVYYNNGSGYALVSEVIVVTNSCCNYPTINLNNINTTTAPSGSTKVWFTTSTHDSGTEVVNPAAVTDDIPYWPFYYNSSTDTYTSAGAPVLVTIDRICSTACYKPGATTGGTILDTKVGITSLNRAGATDSDNWPMARKGGWLALESKTKGFVPNRVAFISGNPVGIVPANFVEGMMVYDTTNKCLKMYTSTDGGVTFAWYCISTQTCPD